jgi:hypothetical protein
MSGLYLPSSLHPLHGFSALSLLPLSTKPMLEFLTLFLGDSHPASGTYLNGFSLEGVLKDALFILCLKKLFMRLFVGGILLFKKLFQMPLWLNI